MNRLKVKQKNGVELYLKFNTRKSSVIRNINFDILKAIGKGYKQLAHTLNVAKQVKLNMEK